MSKMILIIQLFASMVFSFTGCSSAVVNDNTLIAKNTVDSSRILIVYLSRTSNTRVAAEIIKGYVGGTLVALELENPYPENYRATVDQVARENETGFMPPLKTKIGDLSKFDIVFIGFPTWGMKLPPPMKSFLSTNNLSGKTIVPFNTNGGYGIGSTFETVALLCPKSNILQGFTTKGGVERDGLTLVLKNERRKQVEEEIQQWLRKIKLLT